MKHKTGPGALSAMALLLLVQVCTAAPEIAIPSRLSLGDAKTLLLRHNPALLAARLETEVEAGDVVAAEKFSNPRFQVATEGLGTPGPGSFLNDQEFSILLRQDLLTAGKRAKRTRVESADVEIASMEARNLERLLLFDLKQAYYRVVLAQVNLELAGEILERFKAVVRLNRLQFEKGEISGGELRRVEAAQYQFYEDLIRSEVNLRNAKDRLLALFGFSDFSRDFEATDPFDPRFSPPPLSELRKAATRERVDLAAQRARVRRSAMVTELERARAKPNVSLFGGYRRDFGRSGAILGVEFPVFAFDRNQGAIIRSLAEGRRHERRVELLETEVLRELQAAVNQLDGNRRRIEALEGEYLKIAEQSREITDSAYRLGAASLIELLEAERTYRETRRFYNRSLYDYQVSRAQLELAIGEDL